LNPQPKADIRYREMRITFTNVSTDQRRFKSFLPMIPTYTPTPSPTRRNLMLALAALPFALTAKPMTGTGNGDFAAIERDLCGELGVAAIDSATGRTVGHRQDQRFPMCSTFKALLAAAILARTDGMPGLLDRPVPLPKDRFVDYSPITGKHVDGEMSVAELCAAALQYSDNTAGNALLRELGGPAELTRYARSLGDDLFRLDRWETELNSSTPGDERDTTTPLAMARTLQKLLLLDGLPQARQGQLRDWMLGNTTGATRIRAAVPAGCQVADKTGTGGYGSANDIAVVYPSGRAPIVLAIYTRQSTADAAARSDIIVQAARIALSTLILVT
jgi:beta-lactamase class A